MKTASHSFHRENVSCYELMPNVFTNVPFLLPFATFIAWVIYSYVNGLFMTTKSLVIWKLLLTVSTRKMFLFMIWCQMYLQMSLSYCLLATFIAWVMYSYVNRLIMKTKSLGTRKVLLTVSTGKMFSVMNWCQMNLQMSLSCKIFFTYIKFIIIFR